MTALGEHTVTNRRCFTTYTQQRDSLESDELVRYLLFFLPLMVDGAAKPRSDSGHIVGSRMPALFAPVCGRGKGAAVALDAQPRHANTHTAKVSPFMLLL